MTDFLQYAYVFLWGILAVYTFAVAKRVGALSYVISLFFVFMTVWFALRAFGGFDMMNGTLGIIFRIIVGVFLAVFVVAYIIGKKRKNNNDNPKDKK